MSSLVTLGLEQTLYRQDIVKLNTYLSFLFFYDNINMALRLMGQK